MGGGLVEVPPVPRPDPATAVLADPQVAEHKRFCGRCDKPVGRGREGSPGRVEGFCPHCGAAYSFRPKLKPGDLVEEQYDVRGCLAHGGLGWIYLALDRKVDNRPVVLKGLLNSGDAAAMAAAYAERRFLSEVNHPNIVTIHNFAWHPDEHGTPVGYIVMEYVGGLSLKELMEARRDPDGRLVPLPLPQAIAYLLEVLPALAYLHEQGLAYCDFKPDNVIQYERRLKLIDLGAVIQMDDLVSAVYGTNGYQAPEIATVGPSASSDLYTVGRTLAVLGLGIPPTTGGRSTPLPEPSEHPVLARYDSLHRLLRRVTDADQASRFGSADEMADQLTGVLREVLAAETGRPHPAASALFGPPLGVFGADLLNAESLAGLYPDPRHTGHESPTHRARRPDSSGTNPRLAVPESPTRRAQIPDSRGGVGRPDPGRVAEVLPVPVEEAAEDEWGVDWRRGVAALARGDVGAAVGAFDAVYGALPGEWAPRLALAAAAECLGTAEGDELARRGYRPVADTDPSLVDASFGLARARLRVGDRAGAVAALDAVPNSSGEYPGARLASVRIGLLEPDLGPDGLAELAGRLTGLTLDPVVRREIHAELLERAVRVAGQPSTAPELLGHPWRERELRFALEDCLRAAARLAPDRARRVELVDRANEVRPRTWL
ncbi:hypothetical protein GCM10023321_01900 [Pseudonocardia eucalypti]|uniref:non-specific serine/threonine protein kinase n=1 Tax=Pseudonocardia eucalypti TaxID=648755 RepID=A0ABP9PDJ4_9PSEU